MTTEKLTGNKTIQFAINSVAFQCPVELSKIESPLFEVLTHTIGTSVVVNPANTAVFGSSLPGIITIDLTSGPTPGNTTLLTFTLKTPMNGALQATALITPKNSFAANLYGPTQVWLNQISTTQFELKTGTTAPAPALYQWSYLLVDGF